MVRMKHPTFINSNGDSTQTEICTPPPAIGDFQTSAIGVPFNTILTAAQGGAGWLFLVLGSARICTAAVAGAPLVPLVRRRLSCGDRSTVRKCIIHPIPIDNGEKSGSPSDKLIAVKHLHSLNGWWQG